MKKLLISIIFYFFSGVLYAAPAQVTTSWEANTEIDLAGYELHYGEAVGLYKIKIVLPKELTSYTVGGLEEGKEYFFALTAFDTSGNISGFSDEVSKIIPIKDIIAPSAPATVIIPKGSSISINIGQ